jgi:hypothetical protein
MILKPKMKMDGEKEVARISINKTQSFTEIWYEGSVIFEDKEHSFWLVDPRGKDPNGREYAVEVRWWFKQVPREVRAMHDTIVEAYKEMKQ